MTTNSPKTQRNNLPNPGSDDAIDQGKEASVKFLLRVAAWCPFQIALTVTTGWSLSSWRWVVVTAGAVVTIELLSLLDKRAGKSV